jgi:Fur family zinc uptake transcriptional regulator
MAHHDSHNHARCAETALATAETLAADRGVKLTPLRRQVLSLICQSHKPAGAYQLLADLSRVRGEAAAPPTVYRALDFLVEQGLAHKIDSLNAFVACYAAGNPHRGIFLICEKCSDVQEVTDKKAADALTGAAMSAGFATSRSVVELHGHCKSCKASGAPGAP